MHLFLFLFRFIYILLIRRASSIDFTTLLAQLLDGFLSSPATFSCHSFLLLWLLLVAHFSGAFQVFPAFAFEFVYKETFFHFRFRFIPLY